MARTNLHALNNSVINGSPVSYSLLNPSRPDPDYGISIKFSGREWVRHFWIGEIVIVFGFEVESVVGLIDPKSSIWSDSGWNSELQLGLRRHRAKSGSPVYNTAEMASANMKLSCLQILISEISSKWCSSFLSGDWRLPQTFGLYPPWNTV